MALISDALRPMWMGKIHEALSTEKSGIKEWIYAGTYPIYTPPLSRDSFSINVTNDGSLPNAFAVDADRFALSAFESFRNCTIPDYNTKATAWIVVKSYYTAFYAAHALLRIFGRSCTYITAREARKIHQVALLFHTTSTKPYEGKDYYLSFNGRTDELAFLASSDAGGTHISLWKRYYELLDDWISAVGAMGTAYQPALLSLIQLQQLLSASSGSSGTWPSLFRNSVNYQHLGGTWYPYEGKGKGYASEALKLYQLKKTALEIDLGIRPKDDIQKMILISSFMISMLHEILLDLVTRSPSAGSSIYRNGSLRFLRSN